MHSFSHIQRKIYTSSNWHLLQNRRMPIRVFLKSWSCIVFWCLSFTPWNALWCLVEPLFPRYLFHRRIVLPLIAAIMSRACVFFTISKPVTIQTHTCSLVCALIQCFLWWETSVAFLQLHQVCRLWCAILAGLLQDAVPLYACDHVSVWIMHPK